MYLYWKACRYYSHTAGAGVNHKSQFYRNSYLPLTASAQPSIYNAFGRRWLTANLTQWLYTQAELMC